MRILSAKSACEKIQVISSRFKDLLITIIEAYENALESVHRASLMNSLGNLMIDELCEESVRFSLFFGRLYDLKSYLNSNSNPVASVD